MKRIIIFSLAYHPRFVGGAEIAVKEITDRIHPDEVAFDMVTLRFDAGLPRFEKIGNVNIHRVGFGTKNPDIGDLSKFPLFLNKYLFPFIGFWKARALHKKNRCHGTWALMANYAGFAALFFKYTHSKIPFLLTLQEGDPIDHIKKRVRIVSPLFVRIFKKADFVQAISTYLGNFAREMGYKGPLAVIPNGVDFEHFSRREQEVRIAEELKRELNIKGGDRVLITTSRLVEKNGVGDIIQALTYLPEYVKLIILGIGPLEKSLKSQVLSLKLEHRVYFEGYVEHRDLPVYLYIADVFVRPSRSEGMGNSFVEAMAAGVPVIATPVGGIPDFLTDFETGVFCEVGNPRSIADRVRFFLENSEVRQKIIANGKALVREKYSWDKVARDMKEKVFAPLTHANEKR